MVKFNLFRTLIAILVITGTIIVIFTVMNWLEGIFNDLDMIVISLILMAIASYIIRKIRE